MSEGYEVNLWNEINMPGRELTTVITQVCPAVGHIYSGIMFPKSSHTNDVRILHVWRNGAKKDEELIRYTAIVERVEEI